MKGQAALEAILSYGWAILVAIVIIGALAYVGVLRPNKDIVTTCILPPGLHCEDVSLYSDRIYLSLRNGGTDAIINEVRINQCVLWPDTPLSSGESTVLTFSGCNVGNPGNQFMQKIYINSTSSLGSFQKQVAGEIKGIIH